MIELNKIHNMPCIEMFQGLEEQASLIIADPPYGIGYGIGYGARGGGHKPMLRVRIKDDIPRDWYQQYDDSQMDISWLPCAFDALQSSGAMYLFTRWDVLHRWAEAVKKVGFKIQQCLFWNKTHWGAGNLDFYGAQVENILFCIKGNHKLRWDKREGNIWHIPRVDMMTHDGYGRHTAQKPTMLYRKIISYSSDPNDLILDPFSGSGAACIAAQRLHRRFVGCDISPTFTSAANLWLEDDREHSSLARTKPMF